MLLRRLLRYAHSSTESRVAKKNSSLIQGENALTKEFSQWSFWNFSFIMMNIHSYMSGGKEIIFLINNCYYDDDHQGERYTKYLLNYFLWSQIKIKLKNNL